MVRSRAIPPAEELLAALEEAGHTDAPREGPNDAMLRGLLDMALFVAEHKKRVSFEGFRWSDPCFASIDAKVTLRFAYAELVTDIPTTLAANLERVKDGRTLLAIDAHATNAREFDLSHPLYGEVTLFQWPAKPPQSADPRIDAARERGWVKTLKDHNLLPGRGIVVLDEHQGILLRGDATRDLVGLLVLMPSGHTNLWWNPFVREDANDPDLQYWLAWGPGTAPASGWRHVFEAERNDDV